LQLAENVNSNREKDKENAAPSFVRRSSRQRKASRQLFNSVSIFYEIVGESM